MSQVRRRNPGEMRLLQDTQYEVWTRSDAECWQRAEVTLKSADGDSYTLYIPGDGSVVSVPRSEVCEVNPSHDDDLSNVTQMNNLHEAPLLHLLHRRLENRTIYTWAGAVLMVPPTTPAPADLPYLSSIE